MDFELSHQEANANALLENWPQYSARLREICTHEPKYKFKSSWSQDIEDVLSLLKVLPSKGKSCEKLFANVCNKIISFCVVSYKDLHAYYNYLYTIWHTCTYIHKYAYLSNRINQS